MKKFIFIGVLLGLMVGVFMRPTFLGQKIPVSAVITRGASLEGLDELLTPLAERGFNTMIIAGVVGGGAGYFFAKAKKQ